MDKAPDAFRTISEVADELDVPQHVLRFWETRFSQIKPMKRGGGRRFYRPADVDLLRGIKHLLYGEGYTIKGVQRILREEGIKAVQSAWREEAEGLSPISEPAPRSMEPPAAPPQPAPAPSAKRVPFTASFIGRDENPDDVSDDVRARLGRILDDLRACRTMLATAAEASEQP